MIYFILLFPYLKIKTIIYFFNNLFTTSPNRKENIFIRNDIKSIRNTFSFFLIIITAAIIFKVSTQESNYIILSVSKGTYTIFSENKNYDLYIEGVKHTVYINITYPDEIYIENNKIVEIKNSYTFNADYNEVKLNFNEPVYNTKLFFVECEGIKRIDLSHFNSSLITTMNSMFRDCSNLEYIDFSNIDTSNVDDMESMF